MRVRKLVSVLMTVVTVVGLSTGVAFAAPSATSAPAAVNTGNSGDEYVIRDVSSAPGFQTIEKKAPAVATAIEKVQSVISGVFSKSESPESAMKTLISELKALADSSDSSLPESVKESAKAVLSQIEGKKEMLTGFFDLDRTGEGVRKTADGQYEVTLKIPTITSSTTGIKVLHFSTERLEWELLDPENVDVNNQEITVIFPDLSPVMVLCDVSTGDGITDMLTASRSGTSPKTGVAENWMLFAGAAVVLAGAAVVAARKKRA